MLKKIKFSACKVVFSTLVLISISFSTHAQKAPIKFGDVPLEDLKMTSCSTDSSAAAVVLADFGTSQLRYDQNKGFQLLFERIRRVKILKKDGLEWANFSIPLYHDSNDDEKLSNLKAVTYNLENGKVIETKVKSESIIKEKTNDNWNMTKITWPNAKVGSVLEISYTVLSDFVFNFQDWEFQSTIPTYFSEYRANVPEYFFYEKYMQGYVALNINETTSGTGHIILNSSERRNSGGFGGVTSSSFQSEKIDFQETHYRWVAKDVPAFKEEPYMTSSKDFVSKINFELSYTKFPDSGVKSYMGSWEDINNSYLESLGDVISGNNFLKRTTDEIIAGKSTTEEKIAAIFAYVRNNFSWDESKRKYPQETMKKVMDSRKGSSAEINLLLSSMLDKAGVQVSPVLVSTRDNGFVRETMPVSSQFNYVVCMAKWDSKAILLDATDKFLPIGVLPERCLNGNGFLVAKAGYQWVSLQPATKARTVVSADLVLSEDGNLKGTVKVDRLGYHSVNARRSYSAKGKDEYVKEFVGTKSWEMEKSNFENEADLQNPFKEVYELNIKEHITIAGNTFYVSPFVMGADEANPFKQETRNYPVDFGAPFDYLYVVKITLPSGFNLEELPQSKVIALPEKAGRYIFNATQVGNTVSVTSNFSINKGVFSQTEYPHLREFYSQMVAKQAEQIVVKNNN